MENLKIFCISLSNDHLDIIENQEYTPVGLGDGVFSKRWMRDISGENISEKNKYFGEYTFHYWFWKNMLNNMKENTWIGFCQYRKFWKKNEIKNEYESKINNKNLKNFIIHEAPKEWDGYNTILLEPMFINYLPVMKTIKKGFKAVLKRPSVIFNKNKRNLKFHFDFWHGTGNLDKAIGVLDDNDRDDFEKYVNTNVSFNPHNMFICKSKKLLNNYYQSVFAWLFRCEKIFGTKDLVGHGQIRIYGYLAERYLSYWFNKYGNVKSWPMVFYDISKKN